MSKTVLTATLLCDRKAYSQQYAPPAMAALSYPCDLYFNIQTEQAISSNLNHADEPWAFLNQVVVKEAEEKNKRCLIDYWDVKSNWWSKPTFDQDQARLFPICVARNMAAQCAFNLGYDYLFFVDADVIPPTDSIERLMAHDKPLISGLVHGRGCHSGYPYLFHPRQHHDNGLVEVAHATCGFTLIKREVFEVLRFRSGPHPIHRETVLSEDPAFGADHECIWGGGNWWVDQNCRAEHRDNPNNPLSEGQTSQF